MTRDAPLGALYNALSILYNVTAGFDTIIRGHYSMKETLERILKTEAESVEIKNNSKQEARRIKDASVASGRELVKEKRREGNKRANEIMEKANQNADALISRVKQEINVEYKNLSAIAERNIKKAAEHIVERITDGL